MHEVGLASETVGLFVLCAATVLCGWVWLAGELAGRLFRGHWPRVGVGQAAMIVVSLPSHLDRPELAWPASARAGLPGPLLVYASASALAMPGAVALVIAVRRSRAWKGGSVSGAGWARRSDLKPVTVRRGQPNRLVLGWAGRRGLRHRTLANEARHSVLVVGPTQSGKTSGLAIPAVLDWTGPVVATSVKDDVATVTMPYRSSVGPCWIFDPSASSGLAGRSRWSPLSACSSWSAAQRVATWLVDATPARNGLADAAFWYAAAAKQLAPLLLAAARQDLGMAAVVEWTNTGNFDDPSRILWMAAEGEAAQALTACAGRDDRIRSSVSTTLETVLAPFEDPQVADSTVASDIDPAELLGRRGTLYLCGPSHEQQRVQGLFATLVSALIDEAVRQVGRSGRALDPPLLLVLDEATNIAPIRDLDTLASTGAGMGIQLVTVCQDLAQLSARYGAERARTIANNHRAKLLLSGVSDLTTLDLISGLAGETAIRQHSLTHDLQDGRRTRSTATVFRRLAPSDELRRIPPGDGVLVYGHLPPVRIRLRPWFANRRLRRIGRPTTI